MPGKPTWGEAAFKLQVKNCTELVDLKLDVFLVIEEERAGPIDRPDHLNHGNCVDYISPQDVAGRVLKT